MGCDPCGVDVFWNRFPGALPPAVTWIPSGDNFLRDDTSFAITVKRVQNIFAFY